MVPLWWQVAASLVKWVSLGGCVRRMELVGEGRQISRLRCRQVGERRGGLAWAGGAGEGRPGENGGRDVESVVVKGPPVAIAGVEGGRLAPDARGGTALLRLAAKEAGAKSTKPDAVDVTGGESAA
jgi:hypothetical protein